MRSIFTGITDFALTIDHSIELTILVKATIMLTLGLATVGLAAHARASWRHLVVAATFATLLAFPLVVISLPSLTIEIPATVAASVEPSKNAAPANTVVQSPVVATEATALQAERSWSLPSVATILRSVWIVGAAVLILSLLVDLWRVRRLRRDGLPSAELSELTRTLASDSGLSRNIEVLTHEDIKGPLTCGWLRPAIMMPTGAANWEQADLRRAIVHELEHIRRADWPTQLAARAVCAFYWFHPLVWAAWRQLGLEAERACDDAVVQRAGHTEYAEQLVSLSRQLSADRSHPLLGMAKRSDLSRRVSALLNSNQRRGRAGLVAIACSAIVGGFILVSIGPLRAIAQPAKPTPITREENADDEKGNSTPAERALLRAAEKGNTPEIIRLLDAGTNINCAIDGDGSPLIAASKSGRVEVVALLLDRGADPNLAVPGDGTPLIAAASEDHADVVNLLLDRGAEINKSVRDDENALIQASGEGHLRIVKLLISRGADVNARVQAEKYENKIVTYEMRSPLSMARKGGHTDVVAYLISLGAKQ